jgi:hypothetical protein
LLPPQLTSSMLFWSLLNRRSPLLPRYRSPMLLNVRGIHFMRWVQLSQPKHFYINSYYHIYGNTILHQPLKLIWNAEEDQNNCIFKQVIYFLHAKPLVQEFWWPKNTIGTETKIKIIIIKSNQIKSKLNSKYSQLIPSSVTAVSVAMDTYCWDVGSVSTHMMHLFKHHVVAELLVEFFISLISFVVLVTSTKIK